MGMEGYPIKHKLWGKPHKEVLRDIGFLMIEIMKICNGLAF
jgi:hypothetical protein